MSSLWDILHWLILVHLVPHPPFRCHLLREAFNHAPMYICVSWYVSGGQRTTLWSWFFPSIFTCVLGFELRSPDLLDKHLSLLSHLSSQENPFFLTSSTLSSILPPNQPCMPLLTDVYLVHPRHCTWCRDIAVSKADGVSVLMWNTELLLVYFLTNGILTPTCRMGSSLLAPPLHPNLTFTTKIYTEWKDIPPFC